MTKSKLIEKREALGLTRYQVSKDTGIAYDTLARIENPRLPTIPRVHLRTLAEYYLLKGQPLCLVEVLA